MSLWNDTEKEYNKKINDYADKYIELNELLPFEPDEIKSVFKEEDIEKAKKFIEEIRIAKNDNEKKTKLINDYLPIVEGLFRLAKVIV